MAGRSGGRWAVSVGIALAVLVLDQWTKALVQRELGPGGADAPVSVVGNWFLLEYAQNRGVAFGALARWPELATAFAAAILAGVVTYAARRRFDGAWLTAGAGLVIGGAIGNIIDRLRWGYVIDFVAIGLWPNFNVADAAVSAGVLCLVVDALLHPDATSAAGRTGDG